MKVKFEEGYKRYYTVEEYEQAKVVIESEKDDEVTPKQWAEMALAELCQYHNWTDISVVEAHAETCKNHKHHNWEWFGEGSGFMDVRIEAVGQLYVRTNKNGYENYCHRAYVEFSGYLSEIAMAGDKEQFNGSMVQYSLFTQE